MMQLQLEFNDDVIVSSLVGNILKSEIKTRQKLTHKRFDQYHKLYLKSLRKPVVRSQYKGTYLLMCSKGCVAPRENTRNHFESVKTIEAIRAVFDLHVGHDFVLLHESVVRKKPIRKLLDVKRVLEK